MLNATSSTLFYTLSLHDALPICFLVALHEAFFFDRGCVVKVGHARDPRAIPSLEGGKRAEIEWLEDMTADRKSTRLNSSHVRISYAVFCLKKKITKKAKSDSS